MKLISFFFFFMVGFLLIVGCSSDQNTHLSPGAYVKKIGKTEAQLIIVSTDMQSVIIQGSFKNQTPIPPTLGRLAPTSVNGQYSVATSTCGVMNFTEGKGGWLFCDECVVMSQNRKLYPNCEITKGETPLLWSPINI